MTPETIPQTILISTTPSDGFRNARAGRRFSSYAVTIPASMTGTSLAWERGGRSNGPWTPLQDDAGAAITFPITTTAETFAMGAEVSAALSPCPFLRLVSQASESAERALEVDAA